MLRLSGQRSCFDLQLQREQIAAADTHVHTHTHTHTLGPFVFSQSGLSRAAVGEGFSVQIHSDY